MKKAIATTQAPAAIGPYSQAIEAGNTVYVSGQLPINPATGEFAEGGMAELTRQSLTNVKAILEEGGADMKDVIKRSEEHTSELQSRQYLVCRLLLEKKRERVQCDRTSAAGRRERREE